MTNLIVRNEDDYNFVTKLAKTYASSSLAPTSLRGKAADCFLVISMGAELGLNPVTSMNCIYVVQGRPTLSAQTMLALIKNKFPDAYINIKSDSTGAECTMGRHQGDKNTYTATWDMAKAKSMGLSHKDNWQKQFENMCRWRCVSEAARYMFPDVILNLYTPDEVENFSKTVEEELDADFGHPNQNIPLGDENWKILYGTLRGKFLKDLNVDQIESRIEYLEKQEAKGTIKEKYMEELQSLRLYLNSFNNIELPEIEETI